MSKEYDQPNVFSPWVSYASVQTDKKTRLETIAYYYLWVKKPLHIIIYVNLTNWFTLNPKAQ